MFAIDGADAARVEVPHEHRQRLAGQQSPVTLAHHFPLGLHHLFGHRNAGIAGLPQPSGLGIQPGMA
jgi:hypothetical protein